MSTLTSRDIVNHFGDMDLHLMDAILKGHLPAAGKVLDLGCGEGRNGIYFINQGFEYHGVDQDESKVKLLEYLVGVDSNARARFSIEPMQALELTENYDLVIASRILHFAKSQEELLAIWASLKQNLNTGGVIYFAMDSAMAAEFVEERSPGIFAFPDGRTSLGLTPSLYQQMENDLAEVESLRTIIYQNQRVQSFGLLRKL